VLNFVELRKAEVQLRRTPLLGNSVSKPPADVSKAAWWHHMDGVASVEKSELAW
jgi:hypothetical protein